MAASAGTSARLRDSPLERVLISRWTGPLAWGAMLSVQFGTLSIPFFAWVAGLFQVLGIIGGIPWALCCVLGGAIGLGFGGAVVWLKRSRKDEITRSGAEPMRMRAARLALQRGELVDDEAANRLAAAQASVHLHPWPPVPRSVRRWSALSSAWPWRCSAIR